jgi:hypothetical protein
VETSKDDGKLKVKITADKMKDSTISAIRDKIEKIKTNDNLSIDTSKDDGKLKIKIKADISKDLIVPVFKETVQEPSIKTDMVDLKAGRVDFKSGRVDFKAERVDFKSLTCCSCDLKYQML